MILNWPVRQGLARSYDYIIVGAGSAGCVVARRLVDADATVLLVEAGGRGEASSLTNPSQWVQNIGSRSDWAYCYEPSPHVAGRSIPFRSARCSAAEEVSTG